MTFEIGNTVPKQELLRLYSIILQHFDEYYEWHQYKIWDLIGLCKTVYWANHKKYITKTETETLLTHINKLLYPFMFLEGWIFNNRPEIIEQRKKLLRDLTRTDKHRFSLQLRKIWLERIIEQLTKDIQTEEGLS